MDFILGPGGVLTRSGLPLKEILKILTLGLLLDMRESRQRAVSPCLSRLDVFEPLGRHFDSLWHFSRAVAGQLGSYLVESRMGVGFDDFDPKIYFWHFVRFFFSRFFTDFGLFLAI